MKGEDKVEKRRGRNKSRKGMFAALVAVVVLLVGGVAFGAYKMNDNQVTSSKKDVNKTAKSSKAYDGSDDHNTKSKKASKDKNAKSTESDSATTTAADDQASTTANNTNNSSSNAKTNSATTKNSSNSNANKTNTSNKTTTAASNNGVTQKPNLSGSSTTLSSSSAKQMISKMNLPADNVTTNEPGSYTVASGSDKYTVVQNGKSVMIYQSQPDANGNMQVVNRDVSVVDN